MGVAQRVLGSRADAEDAVQEAWLRLALQDTDTIDYLAGRLTTRLADAVDVSDEVWANAARHYDDEQLLALVCVIALINSFNRLNVITRQVGGDHQPGQHL